MPPSRVPTTLISGALGVGKTTAILDLATHRPPEARWVVLVNELGEVGIDGAILGDAAGLAVEELPGGCLCCTGRGPLGPTLARVLRELRPDRLLVEPTGVADTGRLLDQLRQDFGDRLALRAPITLVDPRALARPRGRNREAWQSQVDAADVLVANGIDRCAPDEVRAFLAWGDALWPPKRVVATTVGGELDPAWLDLPARAPSPTAHAGGPHSHPHAEAALETPAWVDLTGLLPPDLGRRLFRRAWHSPDHQTCGWRIPAEAVFEPSSLHELMARLCKNDGPVPGGALRVKGVFHTRSGWQVVQADGDGVRTHPTGWRRDSRLEVIAAPAVRVDWAGVDAALLACARRAR